MSEKIRVEWHMASEIMANEERVNHFLNNGYEPFAVTPEPKAAALVKPGEPMSINFRVWMKCPVVTKVGSNESK